MPDKFRPIEEEPAPGSVDGKIVTYTPEEAAKLLGEREADEEVFGELLGDEHFEEDLDDVSDLDEDDGAE